MTPLLRRLVRSAANRAHDRWMRARFSVESHTWTLWARLRGAEIGPRVAFTPHALLGDVRHLRVGAEAAVGHATLLCLAPVTICERAIINEGAYLLSGDHDLADPHFALRTAPITIGRYAWVCTGAMVLPGVSIDEGAVVAAGAVVHRDVAPFEIVAGNPAVTVGRRKATELSYRPGSVVSLYREQS
jgi:maltose O-acetyltransferase